MTTTPMHLLDDELERLTLSWCLKAGMLPMSDGSTKLLAFSGEAALETAEWAAWKLQWKPSQWSLRGDVAAVERELARLRPRTLSGGEDSWMSALSEEDLAVGDGSNVDEIRRKSQAEPVVKLVNHLLEEAVHMEATDIHLEPDEDGLSVRLRIDGLLRDHLVLPLWLQASVTSRIKILADLDISEKRLPQDGRVPYHHGDEPIDIRVSTLPTHLGEKVVMRLLRRTPAVQDLEQIGMPPLVQKHFEALSDRPQGLLFVTGPTGSGKTSTLYAALQRLLPRPINITTLEDPVEYRLRGANQVQINEKAGLSFPEALRSILRQDPDVILIGEIRDSETAHIAIQAAQTGHLVFSTLHTNDAVSAVDRLIELGGSRSLIASALLGILAQRLVRKVCSCHTVEPPTALQRERLQFLGELPARVPQARGCAECGHTGYKGRVGVFELLDIDDTVREAIVAGAPEAEVLRLSSCRSLAMDALDKVEAGITTLDEILRVALR